MKLCRRSNLRSQTPRSGAALVENAIVISVFGVFLAGILEFGHAYLIINTLNAAARRGARYGATDQISTAQVKTKANGLLNLSFDSSLATVMVKDGASFDQAGMQPDNVNYSQLPNIELLDADSRQMYIVRITVPYASVALLPPFWVKDATLVGQSVMRHE